MATRPKRAIVDVDGTLWNLWASVRFLLIHRGKAPEDTLAEAPSWDYHHELGITDEDFYSAVRAAHAGQIFRPPFDGSWLLFDTLHRKGYEVIVASHREPQTAHKLAKWLEAYGLVPWSGLYTGRDKYFLINSGDLVIDDNPVTILYAQTSGARSLSVEWDYNRAALSEGARNGPPRPVGFRLTATPETKSVGGDTVRGTMPRQMRGLDKMAEWIGENC